MAHALAVPVSATCAFLLIGHAYPRWSAPWGVFAAGFPLAVILVAWSIKGAGTLGERRHRRRTNRR
jgi:hypothetical protein